jgi:hypothetical protein
MTVAGKHLTNEELIQLDAEGLLEEEELDEPQKTLYTKTLSKSFSTLEAATQILDDDPNLEQSSACKQQIHEAVRYSQELNKKKRAAVQDCVSLFLKIQLRRHQSL